MKKVSILLVVLWMGVIFYFSSQPATVSTNQSNKVISAIDTIIEDNHILKEIVNTLYKSNGASFIIRKSAHMVSYAVLSVLSFVMVYSYNKNIVKSLKYAFIISVLYAISDEIHQSFVPGRAGMIQDVLIDSLGAIIGLLVIATVYNIIINKVNIKSKA